MEEFAAIIYDQVNKTWLAFKSPIHHIFTMDKAEVLTALAQIETLCREEGLYAVGYLPYEAGIAFDDQISNYPLKDSYLLNFYLYNGYTKLSELPSTSGDFSLGDWRPSVSRDQYDNAINAVKQFISSGYTYQVNYTFRLYNQLLGDTYALFNSLVAAQGEGYSAYLRFPDQTICSASPELFFTRIGTTITCKPMKGTIRRGKTLTEDHQMRHRLHESLKDQAENVMIVDMTRNDLGRICEIGSVSVPELFTVEKYPTVWQMTTTVQGNSVRSIPEIFRALFPCASITGAPKISTMRIIQELESTPRGIYTGTIGFIRPNLDCQFNVAIRTAVIDATTSNLTYAVGGGIVWDSTKDGEYDEALLKAEVITKPRPEFSLKESLLWDPETGYFLLEEHLQRLSDSAELFDFRLDLKALRIELANHTHQLDSDHSYKVRILHSKNGKIDITSIPIRSSELPVTALLVASEQVSSKDRSRFHKTTLLDDSMPPHPLEEDLIYLNERNELTESSIANIAVLIDGELVTPPISAGILPGTYRAKLIQEGRLVERTIHLDELDPNPDIYLLNSVRGMWKAKLVN